MPPGRSVPSERRRCATTMMDPSSSFVVSIRNELPRYIFWEETFSIEFVVTKKGRGETTRSKPTASVSNPIDKEDEEGDVRFRISAALQPDEEPTNSSEARRILSDDAIPTLSIIQQDSFLKLGMPGIIQCCIRRPSSHVTNGAFQIKVTATARGTNTVLHATTTPFYLVRHKILVTQLPDASSSWNAIWYKDEGGRDKCMEILVSLMDAQQRPVVVSDTVPLQVTLCYAPPIRRSTPPVPVSNQEILRILSPKAPLRFSAAEKPIKLRFRIEDVSKNHQGQDFCLQLSVAGDDVAPALTNAVNVRSKRNKRPRLSAPNDPWEPPTSITSEPTKPTASTPWDAPLPPQWQDALREIQKWAEAAVRAMVPWQAASPELAEVVATYHESVHEQFLLLLPMSSMSASAAGTVGHETIRDTRFRSHPYPPPVMYPTSQSFDVVPYPPASNLPSPSSQYMAASNRHPSFPYYPYPPTTAAPIGAGDYTTMDRSHAPTQSRRVTAWSSPEKHSRESRKWKPSPGDRPPAVPLHTSKPPASPSKPAEVSRRVREEDVEYLFAKQFKSVRTGELLGYPAYSRDEELLGFYLATASDDHHTFRPVPPEDFGVKELQQAKEVLRQDPAAIQSLQQWGSIEHMIHRAMVYEWCQGIR